LKKDGIGFDGLSFEIGWHTHGSVMIEVPYNEINANPRPKYYYLEERTALRAYR
jgi:hypothetical protein